MKTWRDIILNEFVSNVCRLTLVADPDGLLTEEYLVLELRERGFDIIEYEDAISFRYAYETKYRSLWDKGITTDLVVVLRTEESNLENLPYDLLEKGRKLSFSLAKIFPYLSSPIIAHLDKRYLEPIFEIQQTHCTQRIGDNATKDFILEYVFKIKANSITTTPDLLNTLLTIHYSEIQIPEMLNQRIATQLQKKPEFQEWPLEELFQGKNAFFEFLQERWPYFVSSYIPTEDEKTGNIQSKGNSYGLKHQGPVHLPFDDEKVKIYIDDLFVEGKLQPVSCKNHDSLKETWVRFGITDESEEEYTARIQKRLLTLETAIPKTDSSHSDWLTYAIDFAELKAVIQGNSSSEFVVHPSVKNSFERLSDRIYAIFQDWLQNRYKTLISLPPIPPVIVSQIPRYLERKREDSTSPKTALIVIDGLSLSQWFSIKKILQSQDTEFECREQSIFAWIPTLTSVSRQAIFSGTSPGYFPDYINTTSREPKAWKNYWENQGIPITKITYKGNLQDEDITEYLHSEFNPQMTEVAGFVINKIDNIMHGMQMGDEGMHNQIEQWCRQGYLHTMISHLLDNGFTIWITSDHGNVSSNGIGRPSEGAIAEVKGERVRIYSSQVLCSEVAEKYPSSLEWKPQGLPDNYYPLFAPANSAFITEGKKSVTHGGISMDEVIVPFVSITRRKIINETA